MMNNIFISQQTYREIVTKLWHGNLFYGIILLWYVNWFAPKPESCPDANFVISGTTGCSYYQWWKSWHHNDSRFFNYVICKIIFSHSRTEFNTCISKIFNVIYISHFSDFGYFRYLMMFWISFGTYKNLQHNIDVYQIYYSVYLQGWGTRTRYSYSQQYSSTEFLVLALYSYSWVPK